MLVNIIHAGGGSTSEILMKKKSENVVALVKQNVKNDDQWYQEAQALDLDCVSCQFIIEFVSKEQEPEPPLIDNYIVHGAEKTTTRRRTRSRAIK